ncbi:hypothetical protein [Rubritepida flocculans]|uniref:hypothetical protein n=1 Tax=Rubritepida flocculans TaxID=182403 RepID=UPI0003FDC9D0|nr:hypothetical protein [Rubritepida flocculans]
MSEEISPDDPAAPRVIRSEQRLFASASITDALAQTVHQLAAVFAENIPDFVASRRENMLHAEARTNSARFGAFVFTLTLHREEPEA